MIRSIKKNPAKFQVGDIVRFRNIYWANKENFRVRSTYDLRVISFRKARSGDDPIFEGVVVRPGSEGREVVGESRSPFVRAFELIVEGK